MTQKPDARNVNARRLTGAQLDELRRLLLAKRNELRADVTRNAEALVEGEERAAESMDRAEAASEQDERARRSSRESSLLDEIGAALNKFDDGSYGLSEESGEPIGYERLKAVPWARRTVREEDELERRRRSVRTG
jgi:DnaK suppressor protein